MTTGEGGMITVNDDALASRIKDALTLHGINKDAWNRYREDGSWYYEVVECGFKYNLSDLQSAVGITNCAKFGHASPRRDARYASLYPESTVHRLSRELELPEDVRERKARLAPLLRCA